LSTKKYLGGNNQCRGKKTAIASTLKHHLIPNANLPQMRDSKRLVQ